MSESIQNITPVQATVEPSSNALDVNNLNQKAANYMMLKEMIQELNNQIKQDQQSESQNNAQIQQQQQTAQA